MRTLLIALLLALLTPIPSGAARALVVSLNGGGTTQLTTNASDSAGGSVSETQNPATLPYLDVSSSVDGLASSDAAYDFGGGGFDIVLSHARVAATNSIGQLDADIYFSVDMDVAFVASGSYTAIDPLGNRVNYFVFLHDLTTATDVFYSYQESRSTPNESFTLGGTSGDHGNTFTGSLSGTLLAGHEYRLGTNTFVFSQSASAAGASASGSISLALVPEPGSAILLLVGLGMLGTTARRSRPSA